MPANQPKVLPVAEWRPDLPSLVEGSAYVRNVLPRTEVSYGPCPSLSPYATSALAARCQGLYSATDPTDSVHVFAGTATNLYRMTSSASTFASVSKSAGAYNIAADDMWHFCLIKDKVIATNIADPIQVFEIGTDSKFSDLSSGAPKARYAAGVKNWLMVANTSDNVSGAAPWRVWWAALNDPTNWPTPGSAAAAQFQSDYNDTVGEGGWIQGLVGNLGTADVGVFFEHAIWRGVYVGPPAVFDFAQAQGARGTPAPDSIVQLGGTVYYLGEDGFYSFDGTSTVPIGYEKVDKTFFADLDQAYLFRIVGAADPINKMILWIYPGAGNNQGNPNRLLVYHWVSQHWSIADIDCEFIARSMTFGYSLEGLNSTGYNLDTLPYSLDSRIWTGGALALAGVDLKHFFGYFSGPNLAPTVDTREIQPFLGQRTFYRNTRPLVDGGSPSVAIGFRELQQSAKMFTSATAVNSLGWSPQRGSSRYVTGRITLPANSSFTHISGLEIDCDPAGPR